MKQVISRQTPLLGALLIVMSSMVCAQTESKPPLAGVMVLQSAETSTFELPLADFGTTVEQQDLLLLGFSNLWRANDTLTAYGWQTSDTHWTMNWDVTIRYRLPVAKLARGTVFVGAGVQRWHLPLVAGTNEWVSDNSVYYERPGVVPISFEANSKTAVGSNKEFANGSFLQLIASTSMRLRKTPNYSLSLRHGPSYVYGLGMYGVWGNRAFRYDAALDLSYKQFNFEVLGRPQIGLQPGLPNSVYWGVSVSRVFRILGPSGH